MVVKRGDIFYADLSPVVGSEQGGVRPVLIVQNDVATDIRLQLYVLPLRLKWIRQNCYSYWNRL